MLLKLCNEETEEELLELMNSAESAAQPVVLYEVCSVSPGFVNGVAVHSTLVEEKLSRLNRSFPYIATCGRELEQWSGCFTDDFLLGYWAEEIKKKFLQQVVSEFAEYIRRCYQTRGYLSALNPGSLPDWPISGQQELFAMLGGREKVEFDIGVSYSDSFLMYPTKSHSGILFESGTYYENCQHCPIEKCPNRRASYQDKERSACIC